MISIQDLSKIRIFQGGMGVGVSQNRLAKEVSCYIPQGYSHPISMGIISATAPDYLLTRGLQNGDPSGKLREALSYFPNKEIARRISEKYFIESGKMPKERYLLNPSPKFEKTAETEFKIKNPDLEDLLVAGAFVEVFLAKEGHTNPIGANFLNKIAWAQLPTLYGAMLAGVDVALIGAGFPKNIPEILNAFVAGETGKMSIPVNGNPYQILFDPRRITTQQVFKPVFLGIVGNHLGIRGMPNTDGYVIEGHLAGGHNFPARNKTLTEIGEPAYGPQDELNLEMLKSQIKRNGRNQPFWLAGNYATRLSEALSDGALGVQVGTPFAYCTETRITPELKRHSLTEILAGAKVFTSEVASPTGFPFKTLQIPGTISSQEVYAQRERVCNIGCLIEIYEENGELLTRCPAEPEESYKRKGGSPENTVGRTCLCNSLLSNIGLNTPEEKPLITSGANLTAVKDLVERHGMEYSAKNVIDYILEKAKQN